VITYVAGIDIPQRRKGDWIPLQRSFCESIARERKGMLLQLDDSQEVIEQFPYFYPCAAGGFAFDDAVPLISRDKVIAALVFRSREKDLYTEGLLNLRRGLGHRLPARSPMRSCSKTSAIRRSRSGKARRSTENW